MHASLIIYICCTESMDTMAQSTTSLLYNHTEAIPEQPDDEELKIVMQQIAEKNASILAPHGKEFNNTWSLEFFPNENTCTLCRTPLGALEHVPGSNSSTFLLTRVKMLPAKAWIKRCPNTKCLARHSYHTWKGLKHIAKCNYLAETVFATITHQVSSMLLTSCL